MKCGDNEASVVDEVRRSLSTEDHKKIAEVVTAGINKEIENIKDENLTETPVLSDESAVFGTRTKLVEKRDHGTSKLEKKDREYQTLLGLSKAFWTALKKHKEELEHLRDGLSNEKERSLGLENELNSEKLRLLDLENELKELRIHCESREVSIDMIPGSVHDYTSNLSQYQMTERQEVIDMSAVVSCSTSVDNEDYQFYGASAANSFCRDQNLAVCINDDDDHDSSSYNIDPVNCEVVKTHAISACISTSSDCEQGVKIIGGDYLKELEKTTTNYKITGNSVVDTSAIISCSTSVDNEDYQAKCTSTVNAFSDQGLSVCINDDRDQEPSSYNIDTVDCEVVTTQSISTRVSTTSDCEQGVKIAGDEKNLEFESGSVSNESSCTPIYLESGSVSDSPDEKGSKDARGRLTQLQINETGDEHQISSVAAYMDVVLSSSVSHKDDNCLCVGEGQYDALAAQITGHDNKEQLDPQMKVGFSSVPKLPQHSKFVPVDKPKRRLLPASSVLLRDISILDVKDENDNPKVGKGRKVAAMDDKNRTQGSLSLLHLLKSNISR